MSSSATGDTSHNGNQSTSARDLLTRSFQQPGKRFLAGYIPSRAIYVDGDWIVALLERKDLGGQSIDQVLVDYAGDVYGPVWIRPIVWIWLDQILALLVQNLPFRGIFRTLQAKFVLNVREEC